MMMMNMDELYDALVELVDMANEAEDFGEFESIQTDFENLMKQHGFPQNEIDETWNEMMKEVA